jgi:hypothetical protein
MTIATSGPLGPGNLSSHPGRARTRVVCVVAVVGAVAVVLAGIRASDWLLQGVGKAIGKGVAAGIDQLMTTPASASKNAAELATKDGIPLDQLTPPVLNNRLPAYLWLSGSAVVPYQSANRTPMGVSVGAGHILTVDSFAPGSCIYGLTITSATDPLLTQDHLPGVGTYVLAPVNASKCIAAVGALPNSSWVPA